MQLPLLKAKLRQKPDPVSSFISNGGLLAAVLFLCLIQSP
jgi:hypothetical protein